MLLGAPARLGAVFVVAGVAKLTGLPGSRRAVVDFGVDGRWASLLQRDVSFAAELLLQREHVTHVLLRRGKLTFFEHRRQALVVACGGKRGIATCRV